MNFKHIIFTLKNIIFRQKAYNNFTESLQNQELTKDQLINVNWEKRKSIIKFCYENIPFYKDYYDKHSFHPNLLKTLEDWDLVPIVEKQHIREYQSHFLFPGIDEKNLINVTTGGSTGEPLKTFRDKRFPEEILKWRMLKRWGFMPSDDMLMLWRIPYQKQRNKQFFYDKLIWWPTNRYKFDVSALSDINLQKIVKILKKKKPPIIWGYVGAVEQLALYLERIDDCINYQPLVWVTAAPISEIQKRLFERRLSNKVLNQYACSEVHWVAASIPNSDFLLVEDDYRHVDIVNTNDNIVEDGVEGDLLITDLVNKSFPLIKYRVGDRSKKVKNQLKKYPFTQIEPVKGRVTDVIQFSNGIKLSGEYLTTIFDDYTDFLKQFQIIQKNNFEIIIKIVPYPKYKEQIKEILYPVIDNLKVKINFATEIQLKVVDELHSDKGKIRFIKSELNEI